MGVSWSAGAIRFFRVSIAEPMSQNTAIRLNAAGSRLSARPKTEAMETSAYPRMVASSKCIMSLQIPLGLSPGRQ